MLSYDDAIEHLERTLTQLRRQRDEEALQCQDEPDAFLAERFIRERAKEVALREGGGRKRFFREMRKLRAEHAGDESKLAQKMRLSRRASAPVVR